jgi:DNA-binding transcriptional LysR family regulator
VDRFEAMVAFMATVDRGGFSAAARHLGRSPASITRAIAFLEQRTGAQLLRRTTRSMKLTDAGHRYLAACRRILGDLAAAERVAEEELALRGVLTVTAPAMFGRLYVRPLVDAFLDAHRDVQVRFLLLDRIVNLVDEGVDVAVRIGHLPDSGLVAVKAGQVERIACASPSYLARRGSPRVPSDLAAHDCIAFSQVTATDVWTFGAGAGKGRARQVKVRPRLVVNSTETAIASALEGRGVTRVLSYQIERELRDGRLVRLLAAYEPDPLPVHLVHPAADVPAAKARAFVDIAVPELREVLERIAALPIRSPAPRRQ